MICIKSFLNHSLIKHGTWWWMLSHHGFYHERHIRLHWRAKGQDQSLVSHAWSFHCFPQDFAVMVLYRLRNSKHRRVWGDHTHFSRFPYIKSPIFFRETPVSKLYPYCIGQTLLKIWQRCADLWYLLLWNSSIKCANRWIRNWLICVDTWKTSVVRLLHRSDAGGGLPSRTAPFHT